MFFGFAKPKLQSGSGDPDPAERLSPADLSGRRPEDDEGTGTDTAYCRTTL